MFQGCHATVDELAASAYHAVEVDQRLSGEPVQVRVMMGKEPRHFLAVFKGKLVIFEVWSKISQWSGKKIMTFLPTRHAG